MATRNRALLLNLVLLMAPPLHAQLSAVGHQRILQSDLGDDIEAGDRFAASLAAGDFDGDGCIDLAVGIPGEDVGAIVDAGSVHIAYGSPGGLNQGARAAISFHQDVAGVVGVAETGDGLGTVLAVANVDGDDWDDLLVAVPFETIGNPNMPMQALIDSGGFHVVPGGSSGIDPAASLFITAPDLTGDFEGISELGRAMAAGDWAAGSSDDLVIGASGAPYGHVFLVPGSALGPDLGSAEEAFVPTPSFGKALAVGELDGQGQEDFAIGLPEDFSGFGGDFPGSALLLLSDQSGEHGIFGTFGQEELVGAALAFGDFRGLGHEQVLIGSPGATIDAATAAGRVILYDWIADLETELRQGAGGIMDGLGDLDAFGSTLAGGDFDDDGYDDAVFGVPDENLEALSAADAGIVQVAYGDPAGFGPGTRHQTWTLADFGTTPASQQRFGAALAVGDFDCNGIDDLAVGVPGAEWDGQTETGILQIIYGASIIFSDGFESGDTTSWSATSP